MAHKPGDIQQSQPAAQIDNPGPPAEVARLAAAAQKGATETAPATADKAATGATPSRPAAPALQGARGGSPALHNGAPPQNPELVAPHRPQTALPPVRVAQSPAPAIARPQGALGTQAALAAQSLADGATAWTPQAPGAIPNKTAASPFQAKATGSGAAPTNAGASSKSVAARSATAAMGAAAASTARTTNNAPIGQAPARSAGVPAAPGMQFASYPGARPLGLLGFAAPSLGLSAPLNADYANPAARPAASLPATAEQVAVQIHKAASAGQDRVNIKLYPADLGRVDVKLEWTDDGALRAVISAERSDTLDLLQRDSRALDRALQDAGLKTDSDSLSFDLRGHADRRDKTDDSPADTRESSGVEHSSDDAVEASGDASPRQRAHDGVLDLRV